MIAAARITEDHGTDATALTVFVALFVAVTVIGFLRRALAARRARP